MSYELKIEKTQHGKFITLKKDVLVYKAVMGGIAQLLLPAGTVISIPSDYGRALHKRKLRANQAIVVAILPYGRKVNKNGHSIKIPLDIEAASKSFSSKWSQSFTYVMKKHVVPSKGFCTTSNHACRSGIHFFTTEKDAIAYF